MNAMDLLSAKLARASVHRSRAIRPRGETRMRKWTLRFPTRLSAEREALFEDNREWAEGLSRSLALRHGFRGLDVDVALNSGLLGLMDCAASFNGVGNFRSLAFRRIRCFVLMHGSCDRSPFWFSAPDERPRVASADVVDSDGRKLFQLSAVEESCFVGREEILSLLRPREREVITAVLFGGFSLADLAERFGVSRVRVGDIFQRGLRRAREVLENERKRIRVNHGDVRSRVGSGDSHGNVGDVQGAALDC